MAVVAKVVCAADGSKTPHDGRYIKTWDSNTEFGTLALTSTDDRAMAKRFASLPEAIREWRATSKVQRLRPDYLPNRPLTAITIEFDNVA